MPWTEEESCLQDAGDMRETNPSESCCHKIADGGWMSALHLNLTLIVRISHPPRPQIYFQMVNHLVSCIISLRTFQTCR